MSITDSITDSPYYYEIYQDYIAFKKYANINEFEDCNEFKERQIIEPPLCNIKKPYYQEKLCDNLNCSYKACDPLLTCNDSTTKDQLLYQRLKHIQNTVGVYSSLYLSNKASLSAYVKPTKVTHNVCWNQMSDRPVPSVQRSSIPTGSNNSLNRKHTSVTSSKPGNQTPGGVGCDIKHNSYDRYLNRIKGRAPLRRGVIPPNFGKTIIFNPAFPIYGGKTTKTNIVAGCGPFNCKDLKSI